MARLCSVCGADHNNETCSCELEARYDSLRASHSELLAVMNDIYENYECGKQIDMMLEAAIAKAERL